MSLILYATLSSRGGYGKLDKLDEKGQSAINKMSAFIIFIQVCFWVYILTVGLAVDDYMVFSDIMALIFLGVFCLYTFFDCLFFFSSYNWSRLGKVLLIVVTSLTIFSVIYTCNIKRVERFDADKTESISAKILAKGTWDKKGSFVLVSGDKVLTYKEVVNFKDFENGDKVKSVSTGKLVVTYKDLFGFTKVRTYNGQRFEKE